VISSGLGIHTLDASGHINAPNEKPAEAQEGCQSMSLVNVPEKTITQFWGVWAYSEYTDESYIWHR